MLSPGFFELRRHWPHLTSARKWARLALQAELRDFQPTTRVLTTSDWLAYTQRLHAIRPQ